MIIIDDDKMKIFYSICRYSCCSWFVRIVDRVDLVYVKDF